MRMRKVLIANRGEIAIRVVRACRDAGLGSVAVYADADLNAQHVQLADEAYSLDGSTPGETYLDVAKVLDVAKRSGADAVHPGYGFLSENAGFASAVIDAGLTWIGPPPSAIDALGDKVKARHIAAEVGAPLAPGTPNPVAGVDEVLAFADEHGLPIAIKAAYGGGGRGLKVARGRDEVAELFDSAVREAVAAFGRGECFVERYLDRPRHVETQILADEHGQVIVVGTRDCSLQRRHQKVVEEAPAPFLNDEQRDQLYAASKAIAKAAGYTGAGTCEFLVAQDGTISFLEVNTRRRPCSPRPCDRVPHQRRGRRTRISAGTGPHHLMARAERAWRPGRCRLRRGRHRPRRVRLLAGEAHRHWRYPHRSHRAIATST
jgi:acetyl-CoA/propionyl-CoA carboxylase biotin carboxyl carrier protein